MKKQSPQLRLKQKLRQDLDRQMADERLKQDMEMGQNVKIPGCKIDVETF